MPANLLWNWETIYRNRKGTLSISGLLGLLMLHQVFCMLFWQYFWFQYTKPWIVTPTDLVHQNIEIQWYTLIVAGIEGRSKRCPLVSGVRTQWQDLFASVQFTHICTPANCIPPSLQLTPHFKALCNQREIFGYLMQCRTGHGYFRNYYQSTVPSESKYCPCGEEIQTWKHIIDTCP